MIKNFFIPRDSLKILNYAEPERGYEDMELNHYNRYLESLKNGPNDVLIKLKKILPKTVILEPFYDKEIEQESA
jgi:hypothetical protein